MIESNEVPEQAEEENNSDEDLLLKKDDDNRKLVLGCILAFISSVLFTVCGLILQSLSLNVSDVLLTRYSLQISVVIITIYIWRTRLRDTQDDDSNIDQYLQLIHPVTKLLLLQGLLNGVCVLSEFLCVSNLPLGDATALLFSSPLPAMILSRVFLGDSLKLYKGFCGVVLYIGVMFVVKPTFLFGELEKELPINRYKNLKSWS